MRINLPLSLLTCLLSIPSLLCHAQDTIQDKNSVEIGFRHEIFEGDLADRTFTYFQYGRKIKDHDLFFRFNTMFRDGQSGNQYEIDFYPRFDSKSYGYFNVAYSGFFMYPQLRTAAEYYRGFGKRWEFSLGMRTVHLEDYIIIAPTGTIGIYYGNYFTYFRPTLNFLEEGVATNFQLVTRKYFGEGKDYIELSLIEGTDQGADRQFNAFENSFGLDTYVVRVRGVKRFAKYYTASLGFDYSGLFIPSRDEYIRITSFDITLKREF